ncbi:helix-turn-helix domain-containing protein [Streptomyces sp. NPDC051452]|uniref:helix-turn-helix domain-containing protein n=1 Tax=Streptomyces sp. NPDC051452 TaxID=3365654 RepID=UPI0037B26992
MTYDPDRFRKARQARGWSQVRLAQEAGLSASTIEKYEQGRRTPSAENFESMVNALGLSEEVN